MRVFIAVDLPAAAKRRLAACARFLGRSGADVRWTRPENFHLTLKFLGKAEEKDLAGLSTALAEVCAGRVKFEARLGALGAWPDLKRPSLIWAGLDEGKDKIKELAEALDTRLNVLGWEKEKRPFESHITLGRVRGPGKMAALRAGIAKFSGKAFAKLSPVSVDAVAIYKSDLTSEGSKYTRLGRFGFGGLTS